MIYELRFSREAESCIDDQLAWYEADESHGGARLADRWSKKLQDALVPLNRKPKRYGFAPENGRWLPQLKIRQMRFVPWKGRSGWRVLYVVDDRLRIVTILQIRHTRRPIISDEGS